MSVTALLGAVLIGAVLVGPVVREPGGDPSAADRPVRADRPVTEVAGAATRGLVRRLQRAWDDRDARAFRAAGARRPGRRVAARTFAAIRALRVDDLDLRVVSWSAPQPASPAPTVAAVVEARWDVAGAPGIAVNRVELVLTVPSPSGGWSRDGRLVDLRATARHPAPVWALGPLAVRRTAGSAEVVLLPPGGAARLRPRVAAAEHDVLDLVPGSLGRVRVVVPGGPTRFDALVVGHADHRGLAAVTTTVDGSARADAPVQVLLNPPVFDRLTPVAARVVLAHEITHAATGAATGTVPAWVAEGFADFVALPDGRVPVRVALARVLGQVRRAGPPVRLPSTADFAVRAHGLGRAYEQAWLAFRVLDQRVGTAATVDFYDAVLAGSGVDGALRRTAGFGRERLTRLWRAELGRLAGATG